MEKKLVFEYIRNPDGTSAFETFLDSLPLKDAAKLLGVLEKTEKYGLLLAAQNQWVKKLEPNLFELRSKVGSNIQRALYFHVVGDRYVITHGFTKKTQKTPEPEKKRAREIRDRFLEEENNGNSKSK
ncbi:type II toxin-antitoxin system RelE/ParE family toxin [Jeotgalibaca porci]|uniref:type II toxin-antitoxin system RelE/ParE family toxin n=1 Tax=Jeotgalibaca porci TaxID=1868793 RepID=UPI0035A0BDF5